jgi:hypothetical protein
LSPINAQDRGLRRSSQCQFREYGFKIPILARGNGKVVDGHLRLKAAQKLGLSEVPVIICDEWSEAQVKAFRLLVNRSARWATWNDEFVALEIKDLKTLDFNLDLTGFDAKEIDRFLFGDKNEDADAVPRPTPDGQDHDAVGAKQEDVAARIGVRSLKTLRKYFAMNSIREPLKPI